MDIDSVDSDDHQQVRQFLDLPFEIYRDIPQWVPPLRSDARLVLDKRRYPFYRHSEAAFFLAREGKKITGRLAVLNNRRYNEYNREKTAFFYCFECVNNLETACALFEKAKAWARERGLDRIIGPRGFSVFDGMGLLVKGFEHRPAFGLPYNPSYYPRLIEGSGFIPDSDIVSGFLGADTRLPEQIFKASELIQKRRGLRVARYRTRRDLRALAPHLQSLYNTSLEGTTGNYPLTDEEVKLMADQMLWFADPKLIKIVMKDDTPVGFLFAYPDISAALQRTGGRLFPFGWLDLLFELKRTKWININGAGMLEKYRGLGGTALLFSEMYKSVAESKYRYADLVQIGAENDKMLRELRDLGIDFYKTHRMYRKEV